MVVLAVLSCSELGGNSSEPHCRMSQFSLLKAVVVDVSVRVTSREVHHCGSYALHLVIGGIFFLHWHGLFSRRLSETLYIKSNHYLFFSD